MAQHVWRTDVLYYMHMQGARGKAWHTCGGERIYIPTACTEIAKQYLQPIFFTAPSKVIIIINLCFNKNSTRMNKSNNSNKMGKSLN